MRTGCDRIFLPLCSLVLLAGCGPKFGLPRICEPGSASEKLAQAKDFDPYPDPNIGPEVVGGRPLGFINPREEPDDARRQKFAPWAQSYPPIASTHVAPASYYPSSNVIAPPATAIAPPATVAYPPPIVSPSAATRLAPQTLNAAPPLTSTAPPANSSTMPLVPLDYSKIQATAPNPSGFKSTAWPANVPTAPAYGTKITGP